jgi:hypothetical protein
MEKVTIPSIPYIATQVGKLSRPSPSVAEFCTNLHSSLEFIVTSRFDSPSCLRPSFLIPTSSLIPSFFYNLIINLLEDPDEEVETAELLKWWNQYIFTAAGYHCRSCTR